MSADLLLREFGRAADAPGFSERLRPLVVELALRGELTTGAEESERSGSVSSAAIERGMKELVAERPRYRWPASGIDDATASPAPRGWIRTPLGNTGLYINGLAFKPSGWGKSGRPIIRIQNLTGQSREFNYTSLDFPKDNLVAKGDLLVSWSATLDTFIWDGPPGVVNQHIFKVVPNAAAVTTRFLYWLLKHEVRQLAQGQHAHGLAMMHINRGPFLAHGVALPPLQEQDLIVAKVDQLMALIDELETAQTERESRRGRLLEALLSDALEGKVVAGAGVGAT